MKMEKSTISSRSPYFDNAKFILIILVVLAHAVSPLKSKYPWLMTVWTFINTFHMSTFIFISGYFAKKYFKGDNFNIQKPFYYLILYLASQISVSLFEYYILGDKDIAISIFAARSSLWFLQSLVIWYLMLPFVVRLKKGIAIAAAFFFGILCGYDNQIGTFLTVSRALVHFPFFLMGFYMDSNFFSQIYSKKKRVAAVIIIAIGIFIVTTCLELYPSKSITASYNYWKFNVDMPLKYRWIYRIVFYLSALAWGWAILALTPSRANYFTQFGTKTLQVYILHRFLYLAWLQYKWYEYFDSLLGTFILAALAIILTYVLSLKPFSYPFDLLAKIKITPLLKDEYKEF